ncbi:Hypothetical_protein [Hexamita inflata]|uniref:Hypothetical_protein n=1 Tax=Hexamita inflata TaxID=28002 RepID=A0AA86NE44_9EUKA|nr:Hypothetical protein HINF_LOCUS5276 [Hexamita inflata]
MQSTSKWAVSGSIFGQSQYDAQGQKISIQQCIIFNNYVFSKHIVDYSLSGGLIGDSHRYTLIFSQIILNQSIVQALGDVKQSVTSSGLVSHLYNCKGITEISEVQILNNGLITSSSTSFTQSSSGIISHILLINDVSSANIILTNSIVSNVTISINGPAVYSGIILCNNKNIQLTTYDVSTEGINKINNIIIANCLNVISQSQNGC